MGMTARTLVPLLALASLAAADPTPPAPDGTAVSTTIRKVTVYSDRARVTRSGTVALKDSRQRVYVPDLPASIDDASVSASFRGATAAKILSIEVETAYGKQNSRKDAEALIEKAKDLDRQIQAANDDLAALSTEEQFLSSFQVKTKTDEKGHAIPVSLDPASWQQTLAFVSHGLADALTRERAREQDRTELQKQRQALEVDLEKLRSYERIATKRIALEIEGGGGSADLDVTYAIAGPSWRPAYDVRVLSATGKVEITTQAVVRQQTGEDWKNVELSLSTAAPERGANLPELLAWRLGDAQEYAYAAQNGEVGQMDAGLAEAKPAPVEREEVTTVASERPSPSRSWGAKKSVAAAPPPPPPPPAMAPAMEAADMPAMDGTLSSGAGRGASSGAGYGGYAANIAQRPQAQPRPAAVIRQTGPNVWSLPAGHVFTFVNGANTSFTWSGDVLRCPSPVVSAGGFNVAFSPKRKVTVLSDNRERKVRLTTTKYPAELVYEVVAPESTKAFLRATVKNSTKQPFLAGESFIFLDDDFVGRAFVNTIASGEKLDLSLGVDDDVKVERRVEQSAEDHGLFTKKQTTAYTVKVAIKSFKRRAIEVRLQDRVPITWQKDDIEISDVKLDPKPLDGMNGSVPEKGLYEWKLSIPAGGKQDVTLRWHVEHPRDFDLIETEAAR